MNTKLSKTFSVAFFFALVSPFSLAGNAGVDLGTHGGVYFTGNKSVIEVKNDKYVVAGGTITVKKSQAVGCQGNKCTFNLGIFSFRSGGPSTLRTYGQFTGRTVGIVGNTIVFDTGHNFKQHVLPVGLAIGKNTVTFTIDPQNQIVETDETNNSITVTIIVE